MTRTVREVLLTSAALLGALCLVVTVAGAVAGVKPLMYRSGSMAPAIDTGDLSIARSVPAADLSIGDVVSVRTASNARVTHRVVEISPGTSGTERQLTLRGDANETPDQETYVVAEAQRVVFTVPKLGYVVNAAVSPVGLFMLGLYVAAMAALVRKPALASGPAMSHRADAPARGRRRQQRPVARLRAPVSRRMLRAAVLGIAVGITITTAVASAAPWSDPAVVSGTTFETGTIRPPDSATCTATKNPDIATISWPEKDPGYDYEVSLRLAKSNRGDTPIGTVVATKLVTGSAVSASFRYASDFGYSTVIGIKNLKERFDVEVRAYPVSASGWRSDDFAELTKKDQIEVKSTQIVFPIVTDVTCK